MMAQHGRLLWMPGETGPSVFQYAETYEYEPPSYDHISFQEIGSPSSTHQHSAFRPLEIRIASLHPLHFHDSAIQITLREGRVDLPITGCHEAMILVSVGDLDPETQGPLVEDSGVSL